MNSTEYPDDSDSSDEDYLPGNGPGEVVSEAESEGIDEDPLSDKEDLGTRSKKRKKTNSKSRKKLKNETENKEDSDQSTPEKSALTEDAKKKRDDDLWACFKKETNFKARPSNLQQNTKTTETKENDDISEQKKVGEKVKITQIFEFAGEEVKVEKEVPVNSFETKKSTGSMSARRGFGKRGGLGSVLSQLGKKQKITTLEKSKLDWDNFKKEENLEEEINTFNKGKDGYLERQDFLQRTDERRFEIEKEVRTIERNKRMNNV